MRGRGFLLSLAGSLIGFGIIGALIIQMGGIGIVNVINEIEVTDLAHPTMAQLTDFLERDKTELLNNGIIIWPPPEIGGVSAICVDFSVVLRANGMRAGWDFDFVVLNFEGGKGHALCRVRILLDNGDYDYVFVEPQNDDIIPSLNVGDSYGIGGENFKISYMGVVD